MHLPCHVSRAEPRGSQKRPLSKGSVVAKTIRSMFKGAIEDGNESHDKGGAQDGNILKFDKKEPSSPSLTSQLSLLAAQNQDLVRDTTFQDAVSQRRARENMVNAELSTDKSVVESLRRGRQQHCQIYRRQSPAEDRSANRYFDQGLHDYHSKGW
ncbi:hypothetical protein LTR66_001713 [Elasticomyces elasticus]|nr:hypothetical protein LTR66_001713 [Elasticomyces elasticus]